MKIKHGSIILLASLLFPSGVLKAQEVDVLPYNIQVALMVKVLEQDKNIGKDLKDATINIGILYDQEKKSAGSLKNISGELSKLKEKNIKIKQQYNLNYYPILFGKEEGLVTELKSKNIRVLYIITEKDENIPAIVKITQDLKILSVVGEKSEERVKKAVSIGFKVENSKPTILVNLASTLKEGRDFSPYFLSLVKIYK